MAVIDDGLHAVVAASVEVVKKIDDLHVFPVPSFWYVDLQTSSGYSRLTFLDDGSRDDFYKKLVEAMSQ